MASFFNKPAPDPVLEKLRDLSEIAPKSVAAGLNPRPLTLLPGVGAQVLDPDQRAPFASNLGASLGASSVVAATGLIGAVVGGLQQVLPFLQGGGKRKQVAAGVMRSGSNVLAQASQRALMAASSVGEVAQKIQQLPDSEPGATALKAYAFALEIAVKADKTNVQALISTIDAVRGDLAVAADLLEGKLED